jgi:hypothetical protein
MYHIHQVNVRKWQRFRQARVFPEEPSQNTRLDKLLDYDRMNYVVSFDAF